MTCLPKDKKSLEIYCIKWQKEAKSSHKYSEALIKQNIPKIAAKWQERQAYAYKNMRKCLSVLIYIPEE